MPSSPRQVSNVLPIPHPPTSNALVTPQPFLPITPSNNVINLSNPFTQSPAHECLKSLVPLTENLANSLTCPICLEYMTKARQLQCGHLFCADCILQILRMPKVRCALCKQKTGKRMVRAAPLPFAEMVHSLRVLQDVVKGSCGGTNVMSTPRKDGFCTTVEDLVARHRNEREARQRKSISHGEITPSGMVKVQAMSAPNRDVETMKQSQSKVNRQLIESRKSVAASSGIDVNNSTSQHETLMEGNHICVMCPRESHKLVILDKEKLGRWMKVATENPNENKWTHENCAFFSEDIYEIEGFVDNVESVLCRKMNSICAWGHCRQPRASVKCCNSSCDRQYHFICAVAEGCELVLDGYRMFCPLHKEEAPKINEVEFLKALSEATEPAAIQHDDTCYLCNTGGRLLMCDTCSRTTHPACSSLQSIPIGEWRCGVCTGKHDGSHMHAKRVMRESLGRSASSGGDSLKRGHGEVDFSEWGGGERASGVNKRPRRLSESGKRVVVVHTGLDEAQKEMFTSFAKVKRMTVKDDVEDRVTHLVIGAKSPNDKPTRTMKLCKAVARKLPVVCWTWVTESVNLPDGVLAVDSFLHSVTRKESEAAIFEGKTFCFSCFSGDKKKREELSELVAMGGGVVVQREVKGTYDTNDIIYVRNEDQKKKGARGGKSRFEPPAGAKVVLHTWILDQISERRDSSMS